MVVPLKKPVSGPIWVLPLKGAFLDTFVFKVNGSVEDTIPRSLPTSGVLAPSGHQLMTVAPVLTSETVKHLLKAARALVGKI